MPITEAAIERVRANPENELRVIAEVNDQAVGIGVLSLSTQEIRACYVLPVVARTGVGTAIVGELERLARLNGVAELHLDASLTAERFYLSLGYEVVERCEHVFQSGGRMAAIRMKKRLQPCAAEAPA
jgi:GNAT superfamily N-acetyltransferase